MIFARYSPDSLLNQVNIHVVRFCSRLFVRGSGAFLVVSSGSKSSFLNEGAEHKLCTLFFAPKRPVSRVLFHTRLTPVRRKPFV